MSTIRIPVRLTASSVFAFLPELNCSVDKPDLSIDFSDLSFALPFGSLLLACSLHDWLKQRNERELLTEFICPEDQDAIGYLSHIGFFEFIGHRLGKKPGEALGGSTYVPIRVVDAATLENLRTQSAEPAGRTVSKVSGQLAEVLTRKNQFKINAPIAYCFREIMRNVFEHAATNHCLVCAQRWTNGTVEIAIIDRGRGILESLRERYDHKDADEALRAAIRPGISRSAPNKDDDEWANSGFGLFVLSEIGKSLGSFTIISRGASLKAKNSELSLSERSFPGTAIQLRMTKPKGCNFQEYIEKIIAEGERLASGRGQRAHASKSSQSVFYK